MIKAIQAKPITGMTLSPTFAQVSQSESIAAPAEVGQGLGTSHDLHDREDGLAHCKVCGGAEGSLPTECPGARMSEVEEGAVYAGLFDFRNGYWQLQKQEPTLEQFQRWLENKAHAAHAEYFNGPQGETLSQEVERCRPFTDLIARTRIATSLLMQFKLEQSA